MSTTHAQPDVDHALFLIANATSEEYGGHGQAPWTRLNDLEPNRVYTQESLPALPPGGGILQRRIGDIALELVALFAPRVVEGRGQETRLRTLT